MDSTNSSAPARSGIPRPASKLPVPRAAPALRPALSTDKLYSNTVSELRLPRLRNRHSKDTRESSIPPPRYQSCSTAPGREPLRDVSTSTVIYTPSRTPVVKKSNHMLRSKISNDTFRRPLPETTPFDTSAVDTGCNAEGNTTDDRTAHLRRARPSLSERTMETLAQLPPSPAVKPRGASGESRPGSSSSRDSILLSLRSVSSRPSSSSSHKADMDFRAAANTFKMNSTPQRPTTDISFATPSSASSNSNYGSIKKQPRLVTPGFGSARRGSLSPEKFTPLPTISSGSKTVSSRMIRPRASVHGLFQQPSVPTPDSPFADIDRSAKVASSTFRNKSSVMAKSKAPRAASTSSAYSVLEDSDVAKLPRSSLTLRDQIAKAKAAAKKAQTQKTSPGNVMPQGQVELSVLPAGSFDFGLSDDPFNQSLDQSGSKALLRKRVDTARRDGRLNIAAMDLTEFPQEVMNMYTFDSMGGGSWAETVDLKRFVAADNRFENLSDEVFSDTDPRESMDDEDSKGHQFAGLEMLDLHGNVLHTLPMGLRRLEFLTILNLSGNKLPMDCFEVLSQIPNLKDLKLSSNKLSGPLSEHISGLRSLEVLHIEKNSLTSLPDSLCNMDRLRVLNVSENLLVSIPFGILKTVPLTELLASKNRLAGALMEEDVQELPHLHILDVTTNSLTSLCAAAKVSLPAMRQLSCGANRLSSLPDMTSWTSLLTLVADGNSISELPEGFVDLSKLKSADLSGNNLKSLDGRIGAMANLDVFRISGNPLREKKFSGMSTEDLKRALKIRMAPPENEEEYEDEDTLMPQDENGLAPTPSSPNMCPSPWPVKVGGILDRSNTQSYSLNPVIAAQVAQNNSIHTVELHHNLFKEIPSPIAFFANTLTSLNLSHNELTSDTFLTDGLDLTFLKELNLSSNTFNSLLPLTTRLFAPNLEKLDISFNRITFLPVLRNHFPKLRILNASNNTVRDLNPGAVKGLRVLDCSGNELNSLNAKIGLLGGPGGLEKLEVRGNRFRVPRWEILEMGTEATLAWLRDRIPTGSLSGSEPGSSSTSDVGETF